MAARKGGVRGDIFYDAAHALGTLLQQSKQRLPSNGREWVTQLLNPQTLIMAAVFVGGFVVSWTTMGTRIAVLENTIQTRLTVLENRVTEMDANHRRLVERATEDDNARLEQLREQSDKADDRLWNDIRDLRAHALERSGK